MPHQSHTPQKAPKIVLGAVALSLSVSAVQLAPWSSGAAYASTPYRMLCQGFSNCSADGLSDSGYGMSAHYDTMYWDMYSGSNCVNYVAYRMVEAGMSSARPAQLKPGRGNAEYWGGSFGSLTNSTPTVGSIAWWRGGAQGAGSEGHVAYVERVISPTDIVVSESNWGSPFDWREIYGPGGDFPSGFIHLHDKAVTNTAAPTVQGTPRVGVAMKVTKGKWSPKASESFQWYANGTPISGATAQTYVPTAAVLGKTVTARVTASSGTYTPTALTASAPAAVAPGNLKQLVAPTVTGTAQVGDTLTAHVGAFSPGTVAHSIQWYAGGVPIPGATGLTFVPTQAQAGKTIVAAVSTTEPGYTSRRWTTTPTAAVIEPQITGSPSVSGADDPVYGKPLTASPGTIASTTPGMAPASPEKHYQWYRDGQPIPGATSATYTPGAADVGHKLEVYIGVTATDYRSFGTTERIKHKVTTLPTVHVTATGHERSAKVRVRVTAPGAPVTGTVRIAIGQISQTVTLSNGVGTVTLEDVNAGNRLVTVRYSGAGFVQAGSTTTRVEITSPADVRRAQRKAHRAAEAAKKAKQAKKAAQQRKDKRADKKSAAKPKSAARTASASPSATPSSTPKATVTPKASTATSTPSASATKAPVTKRATQTTRRRK